MAFSAGQRIQELAYLQIGWKQKDVTNAVVLTQGAISKLKIEAIERGWDPQGGGILELKYVIDRPRAGRPRALSSE
ncbi:MAG: hypothetical protein Q9178_007503 [Gyalolechia marmorata]